MDKTEAVANALGIFAAVQRAAGNGFPERGHATCAWACRQETTYGSWFHAATFNSLNPVRREAATYGRRLRARPGPLAFRPCPTHQIARRRDMT